MSMFRPYTGGEPAVQAGALTQAGQFIGGTQANGMGALAQGLSEGLQQYFKNKDERDTLDAVLPEMLNNIKSKGEALVNSGVPEFQARGNDLLEFYKRGGQSSGMSLAQLRGFVTQGMTLDRKLGEEVNFLNAMTQARYGSMWDAATGGDGAGGAEGTGGIDTTYSSEESEANAYARALARFRELNPNGNADVWSRDVYLPSRAASLRAAGPNEGARLNALDALARSNPWGSLGLASHASSEFAPQYVREMYFRAQNPGTPGIVENLEDFSIPENFLQAPEQGSAGAMTPSSALFDVVKRGYERSVEEINRAREMASNNFGPGGSGPVVEDGPGNFSEERLRAERALQGVIDERAYANAQIDDVIANRQAMAESAETALEPSPADLNPYAPATEEMTLPHRDGANPPSPADINPYALAVDEETGLPPAGENEPSPADLNPYAQAYESPTNEPVPEGEEVRGQYYYDPQAPYVEPDYSMAGTGMTFRPTGAFPEDHVTPVTEEQALREQAEDEAALARANSTAPSAPAPSAAPAPPLVSPNTIVQSEEDPFVLTERRNARTREIARLNVAPAGFERSTLSFGDGAPVAPSSGGVAVDRITNPKVSGKKPHEMTTAELVAARGVLTDDQVKAVSGNTRTELQDKALIAAGGAVLVKGADGRIVDPRNKDGSLYHSLVPERIRQTNNLMGKDEAEEYMRHWRSLSPAEQARTPTAYDIAATLTRFYEDHAVAAAALDPLSRGELNPETAKAAMLNINEYVQENGELPPGLAEMIVTSGGSALLSAALLEPKKFGELLSKGSEGVKEFMAWHKGYRFELAKVDAAAKARATAITKQGGQWETEWKKNNPNFKPADLERARKAEAARVTQAFKSKRGYEAFSKLPPKYQQWFAKKYPQLAKMYDNPLFKAGRVPANLIRKVASIKAFSMTGRLALNVFKYGQAAVGARALFAPIVSPGAALAQQEMFGGVIKFGFADDSVSLTDPSSWFTKQAWFERLGKNRVAGDPTYGQLTGEASRQSGRAVRDFFVDTAELVAEFATLGSYGDEDDIRDARQHFITVRSEVAAARAARARLAADVTTAVDQVTQAQESKTLEVQRAMGAESEQGTAGYMGTNAPRTATAASNEREALRRFMRQRIGPGMPDHVFNAMFEQRFPAQEPDLVEHGDRTFQRMPDGSFKYLGESKSRGMSLQDRRKEMIGVFGTPRNDGSFNPKAYGRFNISGLFTGPDAQVGEFVNQVEESNSVLESLDELEGMLAQPGRAFSLKMRGRGEVLRTQLIGKLRLPFLGPGQMTEQERADIKDIINNPANFLNSDATSAEQIRLLRKFVTTSIVDKGRLWGLRVQPKGPVGQNFETERRLRMQYAPELGNR